MTLEITLEEPDGCRQICMPVAICHIIGGYIYLYVGCMGKGVATRVWIT